MTPAAGREHAEQTMEVLASDAVDRGLLRRLVDHDTQAFEQLYDRHSRLAYSVALRVLTDQHRAEDAVHDAFLKLWRRPDLYDDGRGPFRTWFASVVRNRSLDILRSGSRQNLRSLDDPTDEGWTTLASHDADPSDAAIQAIDEDAALAALAEIHPSQREVIELAYFGGLTQVEIADRLGEPLGTVKTRIRLGMAQLRKRLVPFTRAKS